MKHIDNRSFDFVKELFFYFECVQKYCWYINHYQKYPVALSDLVELEKEKSSVSLRDNKIILGNHIFYLNLPTAGLPSRLVKLLNIKMIDKKSQTNISRDVEELKLNKVSTEELSFILPYFQRLKQLYITNSDIDFSRIYMPDKLQTLIVNNSEVSNFGKISVKNNISYLSLSRCNADNLSQISEFVNLETLVLNNTKLSDFPVLQKLTKLERLEANCTQINSLRNIQGVNTLKVLILKDSALKDLAGIEKLSNLEHLDISGSRIDIIANVSKLKYLKYLNLLNTAIPSSDVEKLKNECPDMFIAFTKTKE